MIARLQRLMTGALVVLAASWAALLWWAGAPTWGAAGAFLILMGYAPVLAIEFVLLSIVHGDDPAPRASFSELAAALCGELIAAPSVFCWRQPFRSTAEPDFLPPECMGQRGVVLVHGLLCNRGFWNPWMSKLRAARMPFLSVNLEPAFASLDAYPPTVEAAVARIQSATGLAPVIVAHSMGGLVVRAWLVASGSLSRVHRVVTIATPHRGTWLAMFSKSPSGREMRIDSMWLKRLERREAASPAPHCFTCFYGNCDNVVFPASTATLPGADNRSAHGSAHIQMAFRADVFEAVVELLRAGGDIPASAHSVEATRRRSR